MTKSDIEGRIVAILFWIFPRSDDIRDFTRKFTIYTLAIIGAITIILGLLFSANISYGWSESPIGLSIVQSWDALGYQFTIVALSLMGALCIHIHTEANIRVINAEGDKQFYNELLDTWHEYAKEHGISADFVEYGEVDSDET